MADNQLFQRLLPVDITFYTGESPSPSKLNGIFNYIQASYYVIESYLGNGIDYEVDAGNFSDRKMLHNMAGAIGQMGDLYRPINKLGTLEHIHMYYGATNHGENGTGLLAPHTTYNAGTGKANEYISVDEDFNIPVAIMTEATDDYYLVINFRGEGEIDVNNGLTDTAITLEANPVGATPNGGEATFTQEVVHTIVGGTFIDHLKIKTVSNLKIYGLALVRKSECYQYQSLAFNIATSMPLDQDKYWVVKAPCVHSYTNDGLCAVQTCQFCIGNTYDVYLQDAGLPDASRYGLPICGGDHFTKLPNELLPDPLDSGIKYTAYNPAGSVKVYTIQSSILMTSRYFMAKYRPFAAFDPSKYVAGNAIAKNETVIYDSIATYNPVFYDIVVYATSRPDIVYISDIKNEIVPNTDDRYFIIGGAYSITSMLKDVLKYLAEQQKPSIAVYAD